MALRATCDVYLTAVEGVAQYRIQVEQIDRKTGEATEGICVFVKDLCPRALERLEAKIVAGTTPPAERKKKDAAPRAEALEK